MKYYCTLNIQINSRIPIVIIKRKRIVKLTPNSADRSQKDEILHKQKHRHFIWQSGQACPRRREQIVIIGATLQVQRLRDKMWQDKNDTCLIVRQWRQAGKSREEGREKKRRRMDERSEAHQNAWRFFKLDSYCRCLWQCAISTWLTPACCRIKLPLNTFDCFTRWSSSPWTFLPQETSDSITGLLI